MTEHRAGTLVLGLGNPILGDDGIGWHVVDALERWLQADSAASAVDLELDRQALGGLALMERLVGYQRAILVDALLDARPPGTISVQRVDELPPRAAGHLDSAHDVGLSMALRTGHALGAALPSEILVVGVSVRVVGEFDEALSPAVAAAVSPAVDAVMQALGSFSAAAAPAVR